jgi:hypothetical protein
MNTAAAVKYQPVLSRRPADLYDVGGVPVLAGELMAPGDASIAEVARQMRARIYAGEFDTGEKKLPTRIGLMSEYGLGSAESAGMALRMLAAEGLVSLEQGRGTYALERRRYRTGVTVRWARRGVVPAAAFDAAADAVSAAEDADPAVTDAAVAGSSDLLTVAMDVETGGLETEGLAQAVALALTLVRQALRAEAGWDLAGASVEAHPAE